MSYENGYYPQVNWNDNASLEEKIKALYEIVNNLSREMSIGKVPRNRIELYDSMKIKEESFSEIIDEIILLTTPTDEEIVLKEIPTASINKGVSGDV